MTKIDWSGELEAYHEDGRVVPVELDKDCENPDNSGLYTLLDDPDKNGWYVFKSSGESWIDDGQSGWRIRNRKPTTNDRLTRLEAFVVRMANSVLEFGFYDEAKALVAEIAPVDSDLIEARKLVGDLFPGSRNICEKGEWDCDPTVQTVLAAIKRGRALERGEP